MKQNAARQADKGLLVRLAQMPTLRLLAYFTVIDLIAIGLYGLYNQDILHSRFFRLAKERGPGEICQYLKFAVMIGLMVQWRKVRPAPVLAAWIVLLSLMLADDAIGIHEELGRILMRLIPFPAPDGMRAKDLAEAVSFAAVEGTALLAVGLCALRAPPDLFRYSWWLGLAMLPLIGAGLLLDNVHCPDLEQYSETLAMSLLLGFVHGQNRARLRRGEAGAL